MLENLDLFFGFKKLWKITDLEYKIEEKEDPLSEELKAPFELCLLSSNQSPVFDHMAILVKDTSRTARDFKIGIGFLLCISSKSQDQKMPLAPVRNQECE